MAQPPRSAAGALYPHLPSGERAERQQRTPTIADALFLSLSREQKAREAETAKWQEEQKARTKRMAADLRATAEQIREGKR
jgi:hypothetical protein